MVLYTLVVIDGPIIKANKREKKLKVSYIVDFFVGLGPTQFQSGHLGFTGHGIQFSADDFSAGVLVLDETSEEAFHAMQSGFDRLDVTCHHGDKFA